MIKKLPMALPKASLKAPLDLHMKKTNSSKYHRPLLLLVPLKRRAVITTVPVEKALFILGEIFFRLMNFITSSISLTFIHIAVKTLTIQDDENR